MSLKSLPRFNGYKDRRSNVSWSMDSMTWKKLGQCHPLHLESAQDSPDTTLPLDATRSGRESERLLDRAMAHTLSIS